ncbi:MAG: alanine racemase [Candidatus Limnocylindrales bacterium]
MTQSPGRPSIIEATTGRVRAMYSKAIGRRRHELITPALVLDVDAAQRNIELMASRLRGLPAGIRPHVKCYKSPEIARRQIAAGALGVCTATVWEAMVMVEAGITDVFVVNTLAGPDKIRALAELAREAHIRVAVDEAASADVLSKAAVAAGSTLGIMIEVDTGMDRAGVDDADAALALARHVVKLPGLRLDGLTGYEGHCSLTPERDLRLEKQRTAMALFTGVADRIISAGIPVPVLSAGGTGTWEWTAANPRLTEVQAGTYVVMDMFHGHMSPGFEHSLTVQTTVISRPRGHVIVDAGNKSMGAGALATIVGFPYESFRFDEEHGIFNAPDDSPLKVGDSVSLVPGYSPGTVNWYDAYHVVKDDVVVDIWPVVPRGPGHNGLLAG